MRIKVWSVRVALTVLVGSILMSACVPFWLDERTEFSELSSAVYSGDRQEIRRLVGDHPSLQYGEEGVMLLASAACDTGTADLLVNDFDFDIDSGALGGVVLQLAVIYEAAQIAEADTAGECTEREILDSLKMYLAAGADPCVSGESSTPGAIGDLAREWGASDELVAAFDEATAEC